METGQHMAIKQSPKYLDDWKPYCALCKSLFFNKTMNEKKKILIIEDEPETDKNYKEL